jgi:hypothetical protein
MGAWTFLLYQMALFSPREMAAHEIIYVLDDPPRKRELLELAHSVHRAWAFRFASSRWRRTWAMRRRTMSGSRWRGASSSAS